MPRPKAYEPDKVLEDAMKFFWAEGYEPASIPKLEKHLGINRFSIYDSFGSKRGLFLKALDIYSRMLIDSLVEPLENGSRGLSDLETFFSNFQKLFLGRNVPRGCLLCNTAIEVGSRDAEIAKKVESYFGRIESAALACLLRARDLGEIEGDKAGLECRARVARLCLQGILMDLRVGRSRQYVMLDMEALGACVTPADIRTRKH
ncbi:MAG TPA: TetR/AcrR family transcriptional regulator [Afifellaceae bacterium]|nr:TetR/AcrR family transcriptional regulator [Afifellaceae bacterium]